MAAFADFLELLCGVIPQNYTKSETYPVDMKKIKALAPRYPRHIRWSDEDKCYIGSLPDLCGDCCHGDTPEEVARELNISAELALEAKAKFGFPFPEPRSVVVTPSEYRETGTPGKSKAKFLCIFSEKA